MATFAQWWNSARRGDSHRITWICGPEASLRLLALRTITQSASDERYLFVLPFDSEKALWDHLDQSNPTKTRTVLFGSERIVENYRLSSFIGMSSNGLSTYIFDGGSYQIPAGETELGKILRMKAKIINCVTPSHDDLLTIVTSQCPSDVTQSTVERLLTRVGGDVTEALSVAQKARILGTLSPQVVDKLVDELPAKNFLNSMIACDKKSAAKSISSLTEVSQVLSTLMLRLDQLEQLGTFLRQGYTLRDMMPYISVPVIKSLEPYVALHDDRALLRRRNLVAEMSHARASVGALEIGVARW